MQRISRAPELSATLSFDSCWITVSLLGPQCTRGRENRGQEGRLALRARTAPFGRWRGVPEGTRATEDAADRRFAASSACAVGRGGSPGTLQDLDEAPALGPRPRPRLDHAHDVARVRLVALVVGVDRRRAADDLLVDGMAADDLDAHGDGLVGLARDDGALADLLRAGTALDRHGALAGLVLGARPGPDAAALGRLLRSRGGPLGGALVGRALGPRIAGVTSALELSLLLRGQRLLRLGVGGRCAGRGRLVRRGLLGSRLLCHLGLFCRLGLLCDLRLCGLLLCGLGGLCGLFLTVLVLLFFAHCNSLSRSMPCSRALVIRRAMPWRASCSRAVFSRSPVAWRKRRLNASSRASLSCWTRCWSPCACTSEAFTARAPLGRRTSS